MSVTTGGQRLPACIEPEPFGKYTLIAKLARGGMAEIFLAWLEGAAGFRKEVVIKRILPDYADDEAFVAMFLDEARIAARLTHPNVCQIYELGECGGQYFIAMEYLDGIPMTALLRALDEKNRGMDLRLLAGLIGQVAEGLHHAHELKDPAGTQLSLVHRDVSPQNLFITSDGIIKLLDFGIAKARGVSMQTRTGMLKGKHAYMSPEQVNGTALDRRSDVFSLGVVAFEMAASRPLFWRETEFLTFKAILEDPIPDLRELRPAIPEAMAAAIERALDRDPETRFRNARGFGDAVRASVSSIGGPFGSPLIAEELQHLCREEIEIRRAVVAEAISPSGPRSTVSDEEMTQPATPMPRLGHIRRTPPPPEVATNTPLPHYEPRRRTRTQPPPPFVPVPSEEAPEPASAPRARTATPPPVVVAPRTPPPPTSSTTPPPSPPAMPPPPRVVTVTQTTPPPRPPAASRTPPPAEPPRPSLPPPWTPSAPARDPDALTGGDAYAVVATQVTKRPFFLEKRWVAAAATFAFAMIIAFVSALWLRSRGAPEEAANEVGTISQPAPAPVSPTPPPAPPAQDPKAAPVAEKPPVPIAKLGQNTMKPPTPQPTPAKSREPRAATPSGPPGLFTIDSRPYATIFVDGDKLGETPLFRVPLSPGTHRVRAVRADGKSKTFRVKIQAGEEAPPQRLEW